MSSTVPNFKQEYVSVTLSERDDENFEPSTSTNTQIPDDDLVSETSVLMADENDDDSIGKKPTTKWSAKHIFKIVAGAGVGSMLEFYSFGLVAYFETGCTSPPQYLQISMQIQNKTELKDAFFPPNANNYDSLLMEFSLYGIAFAIRPFGGLLFGAIGDKYGRVYSLRLSLILMVIPTVLFAVLPNYSTIGVLATILVFVFRIVQGLCVAGEMSTALVYIVEEAPSNMKGIQSIQI